MPIKGLSLWFMPSGSVYEYFSALIKSISEEYKSPLFEPHVTLLGLIQDSEQNIVEKASQLANQYKPFTIKLDEIASENFYYRSLIVLAEKSPELMDIHQKAKNAFRIYDANTYMPHMSIMYGDQNEETKKEIIVKVGKQQKYEFLAENIYLIHSNGAEATWKIINSFPMRKN